MLYEYTNDEIYIRHAIDNHPDDSQFNMHMHEQCEIYFFESGHVEYIVEGSKYLLDKNSLMIMRPAEAHRARIVGPIKYERFAINFPINYFSKVDPKNHLTRAFVQRPLGNGNLFSEKEIDMKFVKELFEKMCGNDNAYDKQLTINTHLPMLLHMIDNAFSLRTHNAPTTLSMKEKIVAYVNSHLCEELSIPTLASCFYISPSQFRRIFKVATGAAPLEYITRKRLILAKEKLQSGISAQKTCEQCGFNDYSSFYRAYKRFWGEAPRREKSID